MCKLQDFYAIILNMTCPPFLPPPPPLQSGTKDVLGGATSALLRAHPQQPNTVPAPWEGLTKYLLNKSVNNTWLPVSLLSGLLMQRFLDFGISQTRNTSKSMFQDPHHGANLELELTAKQNKVT